VLLAAAALLVTVVALAVSSRRESHSATLPPRQGSYTALAGTIGGKAVGTTTACGVTIGPRTLGVTSPVLPCGIRLFLGYRSRNVLATVIGSSPVGPGRELGLTSSLARRLGIAGVRRVHWSYAGSG
jgi:hypothetical protein